MSWFIWIAIVLGVLGIAFVVGDIIGKLTDDDGEY
jgi:drug/metabolite transporter (DMT)-like permease